jgi:calcineurin-like phosphoesterase family protein
MKTWITSDLHFGHRNIATFCPATRGHWDTRNDPDKMDRDMIQMWNAEVAPEDTVYILGDLSFSSANETVKILKQLTGRKILISGNHDRKNLNDPAFRSCFAEIHDYLRLVYNSTVIIMSHFPFLEWDQMHRGSLHFFGHLHGNKTNQEQYRCMDVGFDATGKVVMLMEDAINLIKNNEIKTHH